MLSTRDRNRCTYKQQQHVTVITMKTAMTITVRVATTRMNSNRERESNRSSSELASVVDEPLIPSEDTGEVVACLMLTSFVLDTIMVVDHTLVSVVVGILVVEMPSNVVVTVQEFPINGNLCSAV